jgi:hypothetical protein
LLDHRKQEFPRPAGEDSGRDLGEDDDPLSVAEAAQNRLHASKTPGLPERDVLVSVSPSGGSRRTLGGAN